MKAHDWRREFAFLEGSRRLFEALGVNFGAMMDLVRLKACVMSRNLPALQRKKKGAPLSAAPADVSFFSFRRTLMALIPSLFVALVIFMFEVPEIMLAVAFCAGFVIQFLDALNNLPLIALDTRDAGMLGPLPVDRRTVGAAKSLLLILNMVMQTLACYGLSFVAFAVKGQWDILPGFALGVILSGPLCVALVYVLYGFVLRFFDGEKLKDLVSILQILFSVAAMIAYQVLGRLVTVVNQGIGFDFAWWHALVPPLGLARIGALFCGPEYLVPALWSLLVIGVLLILHFAVAARYLEQGLYRMVQSGEGRRKGFDPVLRLHQSASALFFRDPRSRAFYLLALHVARGDRRLKQMVYPSLAAGLVVPLVAFFNVWQVKQQDFATIITSNPWLVLMLYFVFMNLPQVMMMTKMSQSHTGAWVYPVLPLENPARAYRAAGLALCLRFVITPMLVLSTVLACLCGTFLLPDLMAINLAGLVLSLLSLFMMGPDWPFSMPLGSDSKHPLRNYLLLICCALACAGVHLVAKIFLGRMGEGAFGALLVGLVVLLWIALGRQRATGLKGAPGGPVQAQPEQDGRAEARTPE